MPTPWSIKTPIVLPIEIVARPGNRAVVHHIIVFFRPPESSRWRGRGHLCGTAPGDPPLILPPGIAKRIPAGSELIFLRVAGNL